MNPKSEFYDKVTLITGAGSGIGQAAAELFYASGSHVVLVGRHLNTLNKTKSLLTKKTKSKQEILVLDRDLSEEKETQDVFDSIKKEFKRLDHAMNNAGTEGAIGTITQLSLKDYDHLMNINLRSVWHSMREEIKIMQKQKAGTIVNVSSVLGLRGSPESSLYCASKHALIGLTKSVALETAAQNIRINTLCPGGIKTPMLERAYADGLGPVAKAHPINRLGTPEEMAEAILWLSSEKSSFVVGHSLVADGGLIVQSGL